jgi:hypothetical protein
MYFVFFQDQASDIKNDVVANTWPNSKNKVIVDEQTDVISIKVVVAETKF